MNITISWDDLSHSYFFLAQHIWETLVCSLDCSKIVADKLKDICEHASKVENIKITVLLTDYNEVVSAEFELTEQQFTYLQLKYAAIA